MKVHLLVLLFFVVTSVNSQIPLKDSPLFGTDVIIDYKPERDQRNVSICSAFNGWLYGTYTYHESGDLYLSIEKSEDGGRTWENGLDFKPYISGSIQKHFDITTIGTNVANLKLFITILSHDTNTDLQYANVARHNPNTFEFEEEILQDGCQCVNGVAVANTSPNDSPIFAFVYTKSLLTRDSLIFLASTNGGMSFNIRKSIVVSHPKYFGKISMSYGKTPSSNSGKFFIVWEQKTSSSSEYSHLYTTYFDEANDFQYQAPFCIDSLVPAFINNCKNPIITCQNSSYDNANSSLTRMILFEVAGQHFNGVYNLQLLNSSFKPFNLNSLPYALVSPDILFAPYDTTFKITFFDPVNNALPIISHNSNDSLFNDWQIESTGYNDAPLISLPFPRIKYNNYFNSPIFCWTSDNNDKGISLFDSPYIYYTDIKEKDYPKSIRIYPNPASSFLLIKSLKSLKNVNINVFDIFGNKVDQVLSDNSYKKEKEISINVEKFPNGLYYLKINSETYKLIIAH